jgi:hypothetical protein
MRQLEQARAMLAFRMQAVEGVATELDRRGSLSADDVAAIVKRSL